MATNLHLQDSSLFLSSPTIISVQSSSTPSGASFHRVLLHISVATAPVSDASSSDHTQQYTTTLSHPVSDPDGETILFDISSALKSAADAYQYTPFTPTAKEGTLNQNSPAPHSSTTFPTYTATITAADSYVLDATVRETGTTAAITHTAVQGHLSDFERLLPTRTTSFTKKPTSAPELMFQGDPIIYPAPVSAVSPADPSPVSAASPTSHGFIIPTTRIIDNNGDPLSISTLNTTFTLSNGTSFHVAPTTRHSQLMQFVNSRGCLETIRLFGLPSEKVTGETTDNILSRFETLTQFSRTITRKSSQHLELSMSSGPVNLDWARWFVSEFCASEHHWLYLKSQSLWLPCNVTLSDTTTIIDRSKSSLLSIEMTIKPDITGPLF